MAEKKNIEQAEVAAMKEEIRKLLEDARAEAKSIVENARASVGGVSQERIDAIAADKARGEELVEIKLFKGDGKYKEDVFVSVNGENCVIQRGKRVKIKRKFAEVLDHSEHQDYETDQLIERMVGEKKLAEM